MTAPHKPMMFVHGWGQSASIWFEQRQQFAGAIFTNLPGHGGAADAPSGTWRDALAEQMPASPCILIGWSLGGLLALDMVLQSPERIAGLVLVSSTPCFRQRPDWLHGCDSETFSAFEQGIHAPDKERNRVMSRFFSLILHGDELPRSAFNQLARQAVDRQHPASFPGLAQGLELLNSMDLRGQLDGITMPTLILHGEQDAIVPVAAGRELAGCIPHAVSHILPGCGHAPFLTKAKVFNDILEAWCRAL
jgi:pimeloyl-[acyl-carrier protein] methyl ester esterase